MDSHNLQTASRYINNLLLSRGLLRDAAPVDFCDASIGSGKSDATQSTAKILNLVHDLVLRRDRELETLANASESLSNLRSTSLQHLQNISRLEVQAQTLQRQLTQAVTNEQSARAALKLADARNKVLQDDINRLRSSVGQIRGQCANDVRRRDADIKRLQRHIEGGRRGASGARGDAGTAAAMPFGMTIISPDGGHLFGKPLRPKSIAGQQSASSVDTDDPKYTLRCETTEFLTQLSQGLSDENDALIALVQKSLSSITALQHCKDGPNPASLRLSGDEAGHFQGNEPPPMPQDPNIAVSAKLPSHNELSRQMSGALADLHRLLTDPTFVRVEEVQSRDEEIVRLRRGWERMEHRWHDAVALMQEWRRRMTEGGDHICLEDLGIGLKLAELPSEVPSSATSSSPSGLPDLSRPSSETSVIMQDGPAPTSEVKEQQQTHRKTVLDLHPRAVLRPTSANLRRSPWRKRPSETGASHLDDMEPASPATKALLDAIDHAADVEASLPRIWGDEADEWSENYGTNSEKGGMSPDTKQKQRSRIDNEESPDRRSVQSKLAAAASEADQVLAARDRRPRDRDVAAADAKSSSGAEARDTMPSTRSRLSRAAKPVKAPSSRGITKIPQKHLGGGRRGKRRSTLSPEELEGLIGA